MQVPLDWIGFHYYTRRFFSKAERGRRTGTVGSLATEPQDTGAAGNDLTQFIPVMPTKGPITDRGLEVWPHGIYDLVMQISRVDNLEWNDGYTQRYGLAYVDFRDQKRAIKNSGSWYGQVALRNRLSP